jgi:putative nucleotidyltransferase with HDIG domain
MDQFRMEEISFELVGKVLEQDIVSEYDVLLLKKGSVLTETNILLLKKHEYKQIKVSEDRSFQKLYTKNIESIEKLFSNPLKIEEMEIKDWFNQDKQLVRSIQRDDSFLEQMYKVNAEPTLYRHSANVGLIAFFLGKLLRYSFNNKVLLWQMGVLHDIGKLKLSNELISKQESLTVEEFHEYKQHPELGWEILREVKGVNAQILNAARHHHERIDGSGYPKGLKVKYLPVMVQIISVANEIDKILMAGGNLFDLINRLVEDTRRNKLNPAIVIPFVRHLLRKHVGEQVVLSDETKGEIVFVFDHEPSQPLLYLNDSDTFLDLRTDHNKQIVNFA